MSACVLPDPYTGGLPESTSITINGFTVWDEGTQESFQVFGKSSATRTLVCYWEDRLALLYSLVGSAGINAQNQYVVDYQSPYPYAPSLLYLTTFNTQGIPVGGLNNNEDNAEPIVGYKYARIQLIYGSPPWNYGSLMVTSIDFAVEELAAPNQDGTPAFYYANGPAPGGVANLNRQVVGEAIPSQRIVIMNFTVTEFYVPIVPLAAVQNCIGLVNSTSITMSQLGGSPSLMAQLQQLIAQGLQPQNGYQPTTFPGQTLLYNGCRSNQRIALANDGQSMQDCAHSFSYNRAGWNNKIAPGMNPLWQPVCDQNGLPPFRLDPNNFGALNLFST